MPPTDAVEARTQEIGRALVAAARAYEPPFAERVQDRLLVTLARDDTLQRRLLGFVDVLSGLAFDHSGRRTKALAREYLGGSFPDSPVAVRGLLRLAMLDLWPSPIVGWSARRAAAFMAQRFIVRPEQRAINRILAELRRAGRYASFDLLGEQVLSEPEADAYAKRYVELVRRLGRHAHAAPLPNGTSAAQVSLKLSSLTADFNPHDPPGTTTRVFPRLEAVARAARGAGVGLTVDAEQYEFRTLTWDIFRAFFGSDAWRDWDGAGVVVQAYLRDTAGHVDEVSAFAAGRAPMQVRLVKGAYWDYETIIAEQRDWPEVVHTEKDATDAEFEAATASLLAVAPNVRLAVASHNLRSHANAEAVAEALGLPPGTVEHQVLYRTAEGSARALTAMGWPARDYVPLGDLLPAMAYLARRILENASQSGFLLASRLGESDAALLRPPRLPLPPGQGWGEGGSPSVNATRQPAVPSADPPLHEGFTNYPPPQLFRPEARAEFDAAYAAVRRRTDPFRLALDTPGGTLVESLDPAGGIAGRVEFATEAHAVEAIRRANDAAPAWAATPVTDRAAVIRRAADLMADGRDHLASWVVREGGKVVAEAYGDVDEAIDFCRYYAIEAERLPPAYGPRGVVGVIPPWNFPLAIPCGMTVAALVSGNAVILKPAEETPIIARLLTNALHAAGIPTDAVTWLPGEGESIGRALVESPDVDMVAFTGSRAVGEYIHRTCAATVTTRGRAKEALTETGGKNPILVCADADLDEAVRGVLRSAFAQANQKCSAASRILVEGAIFDRFTARLVEAAEALQVGPGADFGTDIPPVISPAAAERIRAAADRARREGTVLLDRLEWGSGLELGPLIVKIDRVRAGTAHTAQEEIFGPVIAVIPFDDLDDGIRLANEVDYGLTSGVFTRSPEATARLIAGIDAGHVYVNRETIAARVGIEPFGGRKLSGTGPKAGSEEYLWAFVCPAPGRESAHPVPPAKRPISAHPEPVEGHPSEPHGAQADSPTPTPWTAPILERANTLRRATATLPPDLASALDTVLAALPELARPQAVRTIPGQRSYVDWTAPRGTAVGAFDDATEPAAIVGFLAAALLAGNGVTTTGATTQRIVDDLHRAGVPSGALSYSAEAPANLLNAPYDFAFGDLEVGAQIEVRSALALNRPNVRSFRAWVGAENGPPPGEPGFLRRFALPKAVAINTLRHAVDLGT